MSRPKAGRPSKIEELSVDELILIMMDHAAKGGFFFQLPSQVWKKTDIKLSLSWLEHLKDEEFLRAKSICKGLCSAFWVEQLQMACIPAAFAIMVMKNVGDWTDKREVKLESQQNITSDSAEDAKKELEKLKAEIAEKI